MNTQTKPDWFVCVHEAGHACAAFARGGRIKSISVTPAGDTLGAVFAEFRPDDWRSLAIFYMAGYWAQHYLTDQKQPWDHARIDQDLWEKTLAAHQATLEAGERCFMAAKEIVRDHSAAIIDVARLIQAGGGADEVTRYLDTRERDRYRSRRR